MALNIVSSGRRKREKLVGRYMKEIREIAKAGLGRRELLRLGLISGSAGVLAVQGMRNFRPHWAHAQIVLPNPDWIHFPTFLVSPPNMPFQDPLPIPPTMTPVTLNPRPTAGRNPYPAGRVTTPRHVVNVTGFTEGVPPDHQRQRFDEFRPTRMYESVEQEVTHSFYPKIDGVPPSKVWTFVERATGAVGPLRLDAYYGEPVVHRIHNALPDENGGFGINHTTTHLHNGHNASESDGGPLQGYEAGHFKDFHYPNVRAGFAKTHPATTLKGFTVPGDVLETMSFLWFHDHEHDFTAQNTYKGLVSVYPLFSADIALDTGDETTGLRLPSGEFDIPMIFADKVFDPVTGQLFFDQFNMDGILGDKYAVNGKIQPYLEVKRRKYRFRLLNGGPSRVYEFFLSNGQSFVQLTNDGNLLPRALLRRSIRIQVAERVDVIVDFSKAKIGDRIYLQNRLQQLDGRSPTGKIIAPTDIVEFRVAGDALDDSRIPDTLLALPDPNAVAIAARRRWKVDRSGGAWTVNNKIFDTDVISARPRQNSAEIWTFESPGGWVHPAHPHMEEVQILSRDGSPPPIFEVSRKDMIPVGDSVFGTRSSSEARCFMQFRDFVGDYPMHCHNTVHEDHAMMIRFEVVPS